MKTVVTHFYLDGVYWNIMKTGVVSICFWGHCYLGELWRCVQVSVVILTSAWVCHPHRRTYFKKNWLSIKVIQALHELGLSIGIISKDFVSDVRILLLWPCTQLICSIQDTTKICSAKNLFILGDFNNSYDDNNGK